MMSGSDILFTTNHVITDWPISDHMNWDFTQRCPVQRSVFTMTAGTDRGAACSG
ncbi:unnamed protein product, partial [Staurois parvus]